MKLVTLENREPPSTLSEQDATCSHVQTTCFLRLAWPCIATRRSNTPSWNRAGSNWAHSRCLPRRSVVAADARWRLGVLLRLLVRPVCGIATRHVMTGCSVDDVSSQCIQWQGCMSLFCLPGTGARQTILQDDAASLLQPAAPTSVTIVVSRHHWSQPLCPDTSVLAPLNCFLTHSDDLLCCTAAHVKGWRTWRCGRLRDAPSAQACGLIVPAGQACIFVAVTMVSSAWNLGTDHLSLGHCWPRQKASRTSMESFLSRSRPQHCQGFPGSECYPILYHQQVKPV